MQKFERIDEAIRKCRFGVNARSKNYHFAHSCATQHLWILHKALTVGLPAGQLLTWSKTSKPRLPSSSGWRCAMNWSAGISFARIAAQKYALSGPQRESSDVFKNCFSKVMSAASAHHSKLSQWLRSSLSKFLQATFFGSPCHQTFDNARTLDKARAAENSPPYPAQSHAHSTAVAALPASQRSVTCSEVWAALPSACYESSILSECFIAADSTNILLSMGRYELPWTLNPKPFSYVSLILYMKDHLWRRFPRRVCMFSWAGWVGAWAGLEIDDLGGSTAMTSNFYLSLSWGFRI